MAAGNPTNLDPEQYKKALKSIDKIYATQKELEESTKKMSNAWEGISKSVFGISGAEFFEKVTKSTDDIAKQAKAYNEANTQLQQMGDTLNNSFKEVSQKAKELNINADIMAKREKITNAIREKSTIKYVDDQKELKELQDEIFKKLELREKLDKKELERAGIKGKRLSEFLDLTKEIGTEMHKGIPKLEGFEELNALGNDWKIKRYIAAIQENKIDELLQSEGEQAALLLSTMESLSVEQKEQVMQYSKGTKNVKALSDEMLKTEKTQFNLAKGAKAWGATIATAVLQKLIEFDSTLHTAQKETGIMFTQNNAAMTDLTIKSARFGMSIKDTTALMGTMSDTLNTTNFDLLAGAAENLAEIQLSTGMSAESLGTMSAEMMRMGESSADVKENIIEVNKTAKLFGVNSKKALESISENFVRFRTMGFQGGVESLKKMTAQALRLGQNIDEIFDMSSKARSIEGAMEMSADLMLAGGSFSNINPMDLLSAARKGPQELQKILGQMGKDIGKFDKDTGKMTFDPVDTDRLQIVAKATGVSLESMQNQMTKMAQDNQKIKFMPDIKFDGMVDEKGNPIDPDAIKAQLNDSIDIKGNVLKDSFLGKAGIDNLSKLSQDDLKRIIQEKAKQDANLEEQAKQNQSLTDSFTALKDAFLNIFTYLQPIMDGLTWVLQGISSIISKFPVSALIVALTLFALAAGPKLIASLGNMTRSISGMWSGDKTFLGNMKGGMAKIGGSIKEKFAGAAEKGVGAGEDDLEDSISKTSEAGGKIKSTPGKSGLETLAQGLRAMGDIKVLFGVGVTALAGPALLLLLPGIPTLLAMALIGTMDKLIVKGFEAINKGFGAIGQNMKNIVMGSIALGLVSIAFIGFAFGMSLLQGISWETLGMAALGMLMLVGTLALVGVMMMGPMFAALLWGAVALILVSASLALAAVGLLIFGEAMSILSTVKWDSFSNMGAALLGLVGPLMAFSIAGMMFANPFTMIGMLSMIGVLGMIAMVLMPLAQSLDMGSRGLDGMASGVMKLSDSLQKLDFEKLDKLKEFSSEMADAASGSAIVDAMDKLATAMGAVGGKGGGGTSGGGTKTLVVQLKMPNGRVLEQSILDDIDKVS